MATKQPQHVAEFCHKEIILPGVCHMQGLKTCRLAATYTQNEVADIIKVGSRTYRSWEYGESLPDAVTIQKLAEILKVEVWQLFHPEPMDVIDQLEAGKALQLMDELEILNWKLNPGFISLDRIEASHQRDLNQLHLDVLEAKKKLASKELGEAA